MGSAKNDPIAATTSHSLHSAKNTTATLTKPYGKIVLSLKNQLLPEDKLSLPTPSQTDGLDHDTETDLRIYGCELIQTAGILLKLPQVAMATGQVLLQRFYYSKSLVRHPVDHTAMACVCLASKIEEAPRRVRDVINVFTHIRQVNSNKTILQPVILDQRYVQLKNLVIKAERRVLKELGFSVHIKHPHKIIVMYLQVLGFEKNQKLMQYSWNYMNDSLRTDVFVRYQPETVACACIYLTARKLKLPLPKQPAWYSIFGATETEIKDISIRILKLYNRPKPNIEMLEKKVDELCRIYHDARVKARGGGGVVGVSGGANSGNNTPNNNNESSSPNNMQKTTAGAHNAWGGFISRSGSHIAPPVSSEKRSRSPRSLSHSPSSSTINNNKHNNKRSKKHRSRSRSPNRNHHTSSTSTNNANNNSTNNSKKSSSKQQQRRSYSRSRSNSPPLQQQQQQQHQQQHQHKNSRKGSSRVDKQRSPDDRDTKNDRYIDRYDKYEKSSSNNDRYYDKYSNSNKDDGRYNNIDNNRDNRYNNDDNNKYEKKHERHEKSGENNSSSKKYDKYDDISSSGKYYSSKDDRGGEQRSSNSGGDKYRKSKKSSREERSKDRRR